MLVLDPVTRVLQNLADRLTGALRLRFILQPSIAVFLAVRDGMKDGMQGRPAYFWSLFFKPKCRRELIRAGWRSIGTVFVMAIIIDAVYQYIAIRWFYPGEALTIGLTLACVPYLLIRGPVSRLMRARFRKARDSRRSA